MAPRLDTYGPEVNWNAVTLVAQGLTPGRHSLIIEVTGEKQSESSNTYIQIVGFEVRGADKASGQASDKQ